MPSRLLKDKQIWLCVVATTLSAAPNVAEALLLPQNPLKLSHSWNCSSDKSAWVCQDHTPNKRPEQPDPQLPRQLALPIFRPEPVMQEQEVPAGMPLSNTSDSAILRELLNSPEKHYVLQWLAANDRGSLEKMKRRYPILKDATIAHYRRSDKDWFVLLDGPYPNRLAAMAALESTPRAQMARELYPWTRSVASIQRLDLVLPKNAGQWAGNNLVEPNNALNKQVSIAQPTIANTYYPEQPAGGYPPSYQEEQPPSETLAYGQEFERAQYESYPSVIEQQDANEMYASIAPAYRSKIAEQPPKEIDYNNYQPIEQKPIKRQAFNIKQQPEESIIGYLPSEDVLRAAPSYYTIEWMSSSRRSTLERAQRRYKEFRDTQILHYRELHRDHYLLVSKIFGKRRDAVGALSRPLSLQSFRSPDPKSSSDWLFTKVSRQLFRAVPSNRKNRTCTLSAQGFTT